jgi:hypothetical protein
MYTYDHLVTSNLNDVRLIIADTDSTNPQFQDEQISRFLGITGTNVLRAAAMALTVIASNESMVQKQVSLLGLSTNGPAVAADLRKHAAWLMEQAEYYEAQAGGAFDVAEQVVDVFTFRERVIKQWERMQIG